MLELEVEFLLLECLQDMTGGVAAFYLASYSFMVDITTPSTRTRRLAILDSFMSVGGLIGLQLGTLLKRKFGFISVFTTGVVLMTLSLVYLIFFITENKRKKEERSGVEEVAIRLDSGEVKTVV